MLALWWMGCGHSLIYALPSPPVGPQEDDGACVVVHGVTTFAGPWQQTPLHAVALEGGARALSTADGIAAGGRHSAITELHGTTQRGPGQIWSGLGWTSIAHYGLTSRGDAVFAGDIHHGLVLDEGLDSEHLLEGRGVVVVRQAPDGHAVWTHHLESPPQHLVALVDAAVTTDDGAIAAVHGSLDGDTLLSLGPEGHVRWQLQVSDGGATEVQGLAYHPTVDELSVAIDLVGTHEVEIRGVDSAPVLIDPAGPEAVIARYRADGSLRWVVRTLGFTANATTIAAGHDGHVLVGGDFTRAISVGFGRPSEVALSSQSTGSTGWLARLDTEGEVQWAHQVYAEQATTISTTTGVAQVGDRVLWAGRASGPYGFGAARVVTWPAGRVGGEPFVARLGPDGRIECASRWLFGLPAEGEAVVFPTHLTGLASGQASLLAGVFGAVELAPGPHAQALTSDHEDAVELLLELP